MKRACRSACTGSQFLALGREVRPHYSQAVQGVSVIMVFAWHGWVDFLEVGFYIFLSHPMTNGPQRCKLI